MSSRVNFCAWMPCSEKSSAWTSPRQDGSDTSTCTQRLRLRQRADRAGDLLGGQEQKAVTGEKRALAQLLDRGEQVRVGRSFSARALLAAVARSEVAASTTARIFSWFP